VSTVQWILIGFELGIGIAIGIGFVRAVGYYIDKLQQYLMAKAVRETKAAQEAKTR
jgi:hypothetical protein